MIWWNRLLREQDGQDSAEYALFFGFVAFVCMAMIAPFRQAFVTVVLNFLIALATVRDEFVALV